MKSANATALESHHPGPLTEVEWDIVHRALLARRVESRLLELFSQGKLFGTVHTCIGQEFSGAVITKLLEKGDSIFSNHRCHGHFLGHTGDVNGLISEIMGKSTGVCGGRGGSQHLYKDNFFSNGIQGGITPVSAGLALARRFKANKKISVVFIGDGTLGEGVLYETFNIASKWNLPLLFVLENNRYAQSTSQKETLAGDICDRAKAFSIKTAQSDTWGWRDLYSVAEEMVKYVRTNSRPGFLQIDTYRLKPHSKGDDNRSPLEISEHEAKDPLNRLSKEDGPHRQRFDELSKKINEMVEKAIVEAEAAPFPSAPPGFSANLQAHEPAWTEASVAKKRVGEATNLAFKDLMAKHPEMVFIGEDIKSPYGGAFKVTSGLSDQFPDRVFNTPISEGAIAGIGNGLALDGFRPFVEIMFGDFTGLAFDQLINHAAKFEFMYNNQVKTNVVVRTPMGGRRGYGPTHSQTLDRHFLGAPGLQVLAVNNLMEPVEIYGRLMKEQSGATLLIENKILYGQFLRHELPTGFKRYISNEKFPTVHIKPGASRIDVTLIGYGGMSEILVACLDELFEKHDIVAQVLCPSQIYPFSVKPYLNILNTAPSLVVVEEGQGFGSFGSEIMAQLAELEPRLVKNSKRILPLDIPIPSSGILEKSVLPDVQSIAAEVSALVSKSNTKL